MKKILVLLLLLPVLVLSARASAVQSMIDALPAVEEFSSMDSAAQQEAYNRTQAAYDAYMALSENEKAEIAGAEKTFEALFNHFNTLIAPAEEAPEEPGTGSELLSTVIACLAGLFLARKIVTKRKL